MSDGESIKKKKNILAGRTNRINLFLFALLLFLMAAVAVVVYNDHSLSDISELLPLIFIMLSALIVYIVIRSTLVDRLIFAPLYRLIQSVTGDKATDVDFFGKDRDDEIGDLARTIHDTTLDRQRQELRLHALNCAAAVLLAPVKEEDFEASIREGMELMGRCVDVDHVLTWRNEMINGDLHFVLQHAWLNGKEEIPVPICKELSYSEHPDWESKFSRNESINGALADLSLNNQKWLEPYGVRSVLMIPIYLEKDFWGFISFHDCHKERIFTVDEVNILRYAGLMLVSAKNRNSQAAQLREAHEQLQEALKTAQDASEAKSSFLAHMSHEMRTPLNAVIGLADLILQAGGLNEEASLYLDRIYNAGQTLLSTVNDLLDISKIEAGKLELVPVNYGLSGLINDAVAQSIMRIGEKPIKFVLDINEDLPAGLYGDDLRIKQILNNLLSNAFKYTSEGTVTLSMESEREGDSVWMTVKVRDTGKGIRLKDMNTLFKDYVKMDLKANRKIEGTGLGLSITKKIVEMMDGSIAAESEYGKGSVFIVKFRQQFVTDETIGAEAVKKIKNFRYSEKNPNKHARFIRIRLPYARVLVVDDVVTNLDVAKGMMKPYAMQVDCVTGGQEAIDLVRAEEVLYNAIFMDQMMPGIDGLETTRIIREEIGTEYARTVPIIALTANAIVGNEEMF
jgi:signal transduction histidine kinase